MEDKVKLTPVGSDFFKETYFAERPPCERLVNRKLNIRNMNLMSDWRVALKAYIDNYYQGYLD
jgi:dTDP-4-dehydrorhamnose reductase